MTPAAWIKGLAPRERNALIAGAAIALALAAYGWLWLPLAGETARLRAGAPQLRAQAAQLETDAAEAKRLIAMPKPQAGVQVSGDTLAGGVEASVQGAGIKDKVRVQPLDGARVQITSEGIGFNEWIGLLASLQQLRNARVSSARVEPVPGAPLVRAQAVLAGPGAKS